MGGRRIVETTDSADCGGAVRVHPVKIMDNVSGNVLPIQRFGSLIYISYFTGLAGEKTQRENA